MSDPIPGKASSAPTAMAKIRAKRAELDAQIAAGEITAEEAQRQYRTFQSLMISHVREHGAESGETQ